MNKKWVIGLVGIILFLILFNPIVTWRKVDSEYFIPEDLYLFNKVPTWTTLRANCNLVPMPEECDPIKTCVKYYWVEIPEISSPVGGFIWEFNSSKEAKSCLENIPKLLRSHETYHGVIEINKTLVHYYSSTYYGDTYFWKANRFLFIVDTYTGYDYLKDEVVTSIVSKYPLI